jgi:hypothetical protein
MAGIPPQFKTRISNPPRKVYTSHRHPDSMKVTRWAMFREESVLQGKILQWWVNPSECQWKVATRTSVDKIPGGAVHHEWPQTGHMNSNSFSGSRFDQPYLSISFQAGIITRGGYDDLWNNAPSTDIPYGLGNFYDFMALLNAPDVTASGEPNYINILYISPIFGQTGMRLQGYFSEDGVSWTDTAENPNTITSWGATFVVLNCNPALRELRHCFKTIGIRT